MGSMRTSSTTTAPDPAAFVPTTLLAATLACVLATATFVMDSRYYVVQAHRRHVDLYHHGWLVGMAAQRDGLSYLHALGGGHERRRRHRELLAGWVADFVAAGLLEAAVAQLLLAEDQRNRELTNARSPRFAASPADAAASRLYSPTGSRDWGPAQVAQHLAQHRQALVWDRRQEVWIR